MKNKSSIALLALFFVSSFAFAQNKETRTVDTFTKISFRLPGKLYLTQGAVQSLELKGDKDVLKEIETEVKDGKLIIGKEGKWLDWSWGNNDKDKIEVYITVKDVEALSVSGSGDLIGQTKIVSSNLSLNVSGSGEMKVEVESADNLEADVSGSGQIELKGKCKDFDSDISGSGKVYASSMISQSCEFGVSGSGKIEMSGTTGSVSVSVSGSGKLLASNLEAERCKVRISGSGDVEINVRKELDANISGSGSVSYKGNPDQVNSHASGSGHVKKM